MGTSPSSYIQVPPPPGYDYIPKIDTKEQVQEFALNLMI